MLEPTVDHIGPVASDFEDIEWELCCSTREAGVGYILFASADRVLPVPRPLDTNASTKPWAAA